MNKNYSRAAEIYKNISLSNYSHFEAIRHETFILSKVSTNQLTSRHFERSRQRRGLGDNVGRFVRRRLSHRVTSRLSIAKGGLSRQLKSTLAVCCSVMGLNTQGAISLSLIPLKINS